MSPNQPSPYLQEVALIDEQHQLIFQYGHKVLEHTDLPVSSEQGGELLKSFCQLLIEHFDTEEALMFAAEFPAEEIHAHIAEHGRLLESLITLSFCNAKEKVASVAPVILSIIDDHVSTFDAVLINHVNNARG